MSRISDLGCAFLELDLRHDEIGVHLRKEDESHQATRDEPAGEDQEPHEEREGGVAELDGPFEGGVRRRSRRTT